jgi:hypothetical protein
MGWSGYVANNCLVIGIKLSKTHPCINEIVNRIIDKSKISNHPINLFAMSKKSWYNRNILELMHSKYNECVNEHWIECDCRFDSFDSQFSIKDDSWTEVWVYTSLDLLNTTITDSGGGDIHHGENDSIDVDTFLTLVNTERTFFQTALADFDDIRIELFTVSNSYYDDY